MSLSSSEYIGYLSVQIILFVLGGLANLVVIAIVWKHKQLHSFTNYFLVNLAVADLLTLFFGTVVDIGFCIVEPSQNVNQSHACEFNETYRKDIIMVLHSVSLLKLLFKIISNLTLMCLAIGRYTALVETLSSVTNILHRKSTLVFLWGIPLPAFITEAVLWGLYFNDLSDSLRYSAIAFSIFSLFVLFVVPALIIVYCYGSIMKGIYLDKTILGESESNGASDSLNKKIVYRLIIVTIVSVLTTIPIVGMWLYIIFNECIMSDLIIQMYLSLASLDKIVATVNPVFYTLLNTSMRHAILKDLRRLKLPNKIRRQIRPEDNDKMEDNMEERPEQA